MRFVSFSHVVLSLPLSLNLPHSRSESAGLSQVCYDQPDCTGQQLPNATAEVDCCAQDGRSLLNNGNCTTLECLGKFIAAE